MPARPAKPGEPGFVPRYPPIDLSAIDRRIIERREDARAVMKPATREVVEADTDLIELLVLEVRNKTLALAALKTVIDAMQLYRKPPKQ